MADANALHEARALLRAFLKSDLRAAEIRTGALELWLSRDSSLRPSGVASPDQSEVAAPALSAPHLGTLAWLATPGTALAAGDICARLAVLDEERPVPATIAGTVTAQCRAIGDLVECGEPLLKLAH